MEESRAIVKSVSPNGTWDSKYGTMYKFEVHFDNGDYGEYNSKSPDQTKFVTGQEASYTRTSREYNGQTFYTIKPPAMPFNGSTGGGGYRGKDPKTEGRIVRMNVLQRATDLVVGGHVMIGDMKAVAEDLEKWVLRETEEKAVVETKPPAVGNDLPF